MKISAQRLRNLTTGRLHTKMDDIYQDLDFITGANGLMTHMLPRALRSAEPWLREHVKDARFWDDAYDTTHEGEIEIPDPTREDQQKMFAAYREMPNPLAGKDVVVVEV